MGDIFVDRDPKEVGDKKRPVVEVPVGTDKPMAPPKKAKGVKKTAKGKSKEKVVKVEDDEEDCDDNDI
ncbi:predicted protein [Sclerotinia sclerotiorum 1980 UF-70]|uniref:Uncharacterized protein n=2 Tax=Sclerotinia sclerotiorum (strain ATCC 18683 / 1980 / Ss-1) TaxID=665079 RepID=A7E629_SCLS1|nr:predicted protein [Sclerotinia sclerotiorum 1980 UF-70]APA07694.1 hypothetical protein sscle_03g024640 [Sclerotinia sclerotiorum 1980 UF-70]EDN91351.1 predicted protein [Sclerotinia sclerotiorum 1980 UF-70]